jgi:ADP-ribosylglycohydrolase
MIAYILRDDSISDAMEKSLRYAESFEYFSELSRILDHARLLALDASVAPSDAIHRLGGGWVGEEALAIAVYCALRFSSSFRDAIIAAVNHDGDSDSTGAICGAMLGAALGVGAIPGDWLEVLENRNDIARIADLMHGLFVEGDCKLLEGDLPC